MNPSTARRVPAKALEAPSTVSPELRRSIAMMAAMPAIDPGQLPTTADGWRRYIAERDQQTLALNPILSAAFPHAVSKADIAGVPAYTIVPAAQTGVEEGRLLLNFHGGGYALFGGDACVAEGVVGAHYAKATVICADYRMPPDHPFPAAVEDAVAVFKALSASHDPARIGVFGTSAGGGLVLAMVHRLKALGAPLPGALALGTPWADLSAQSDSTVVNMGVDGILTSAEALMAMAKLYAGETPLTDPLVSPVYGDFEGFPPAILTTGTRDVLLSDTVRVYRGLRAAGVDARLEVYEAMSHAEYLTAFDSPESASVFTDMARFFEARLWS